MGSLQLNSYGLAASFPVSHNFKNKEATLTTNTRKAWKSICFSRGKIRAVGTTPENQTEQSAEEPPSVKFAFVSVSRKKTRA